MKLKYSKPRGQRKNKNYSWVEFVDENDKFIHLTYNFRNRTVGNRGEISDFTGLGTTSVRGLRRIVRKYSAELPKGSIIRLVTARQRVEVKIK